MTIDGIINAIPLAAIAINRDEHLICANEKAVKILGSPMLNNHFIHSIRYPDIVEAIENVFATSQAQTVVWRASRHSLDLFYDVTVSLIDHDIALVSFEDRTAFEQGRQVRRDFVTNVSHELKTPLTSIIGFLETLETVAKDDPEARTRFLQMMKQEAYRMNRLVSDLLSLNHIENNVHTRPTDLIDLTAILRLTLENLGPVLARNGNEALFDAPTKSVMIQGDADQLRQVFSNLIENAMKYGGPDKAIKISLGEIMNQSLLRADGVAVDVTDTGPGISHVHLARLTERFYRIDSHRSRQVGGTGLGLSIVKHIITRHRGRLSIKSEIGQGTTFSVILPK